MPRIRILIAGIPRMLSDIIVRVLDSDIEVVATLPDPMGVMKLLDNRGADLVVLGFKDAQLPTEAAALFETHPQVKVLGVIEGGRRALLYELRPSFTEIGELSVTGLRDAIRGAKRKTPD